MAADYLAALQRDHGDHLRFEFESELGLDNDGVRLFHRAFIDDLEVMVVGIDLNVERDIPLWHEPDIVPFPDQILRTEEMGFEPNLRIISIQDMLAHKISGMHKYGYRTQENRCDDCLLIREGHYACKMAGSEMPYRPQDLADVLLLALHTPVDGRETHEMLRQEFEYRRERGEVLHVPDRFELPNPNWGEWFGNHLKTIDALPFRTLHEALPLARNFLDPLLSPEPLHGHWDPQQRRWSEASPAPMALGGLEAGKAITRPPSAETAGTATPAPPGVRRIEGTGAAQPSTIAPDPEYMEQWDRLAVEVYDDHSLDAYLTLLTYDDEISVPDKLAILHRDLDKLGYEATVISGVDNKTLRFYSHQTGEESVHAAALILDPETTLDLAFQPLRAYESHRLNAHQSHFAYLGERPEGMTAAEANAAAFWWWTYGKPPQEVSRHDLVRGLLEIHSEPLRMALDVRRRLIEDCGIDPRRIRLVHGGEGRDASYSRTQWVRANLFALSRIRDNPRQARDTLVAAMLGEGRQPEFRSARAGAELERLFNVHEGDGSGPKKYTLLWIRDSRPSGTRGPELDTRPEYIRQIIETLRERQPDREIVLIGDDLFERRTGLHETWQRAGALDDVDVRTLTRFWVPRSLSRAEQWLFFHRLATQRDVVQIGMESGTLEMPIMLGVPTVYISAREYTGNKANRWAHYFEPWVYGRTVQVVDDSGNYIYDPASGLPKTEFRPYGDPLPAPLATIERVPVGPDLPDPSNRNEHPIAVYHYSKVSLTTTRIIDLITSAALARWSGRLGRSAGLRSAEWEPWTERDWQTSRFYADQLHRWLHTEAATSAEHARKWDAIRLALKGVVEPGYTGDETRFIYLGTSIVHPYFELYSDHPAPADGAFRISEAYAQAPQARPAAVAELLNDMFASAGIGEQALNALSAFRLEPSELDHLHEAIDRVVSRNSIFPIAPFVAPPGGSAWDAPGAVHHSMRPSIDSIQLPDYYLTYILDGRGGGGGHRHGAGVPGKTEFPARWDDETVVRYLVDIARAPDRALFQSNGRWNVVGARDDVTVNVIIRTDGRIWSAFPLRGRGVIQNPRE